MDDIQIQRLAAAGHELRPDWPVKSLATFLAKHFANRAYADVVLVLAKVATVDPPTETPRLMLEDWPWKVTAPVGASEAARHTSSVPWTQLCDHCQRSEAHCRDPKVQAEDPHAFTTAALRRAREAKAKPAPQADPTAKPYVNPELRAGIRADLLTARRALASQEADWAERTKASKR